jgi:hypothetical protein
MVRHQGDIEIFLDLCTEESQAGSEDRDCYNDFMLSHESKGVRLGQAFFNALPEKYQSALRGTIYDPFYKNEYSEVLRAINFLTSSYPF